MKLFAPLALTLGTASAESCGTVSVSIERMITKTYHFGAYPTGYQNFATDWKALFLSDVLDAVFTVKYSAAAAAIDYLTLGDVYVYDMKNDFVGCDVGKYCTQMNLMVHIPLTFTFVEDVPCEGSADIPDDSDIASRMEGLGIDLDGLGIDGSTEIDVPVDIDDIVDAIDTELETNPIDGVDPDDIDIEEGTTETEDNSTTTVTDGDGNDVEINGNCAGVVDNGCVCDDGFEGDLCTDDIDECAAVVSPCADGEDCNNTDGAYFCVNAVDPACPAGFEGVFPACVDINECDLAVMCGDNQVCVNTQGGYNCDCMAGFELDLEGNCVDIDECAESPCVNGLCEDGVDAYTCNCFENFVKLPSLSDDVCYLQSAYECFDGSNGGCSHFCR